MGGVAGAPGEGARLTRWGFSLDLPRLTEGAAAVVAVPHAVVVRLTQPAAAVLDRPTGQAGRSAARRDVLAALAERLGLLADEALLIAGTDGMRRLGRTGLFASVAERGGWVAAVIAPVAVGIDVEAAADADLGRDVVLADATVDDLSGWHGLAGVWAAREAVLKATGRDLTRDPGGWRFAAGRAAANGIAPHQIDLIALSGIVAAVAYAGG